MDKKEYYKQWREAHKDELREYARRYNEEHREQLAADKRARYLANREEILKRIKERYQQNPQPMIERATEWNKHNREKHRAAESRWAKANAPKKREACKRFRESHPEFHKKRLAEWRKRNPLLVKFYTQQRRARIAGSNGTITPEQVAALYEKQGGKCAACHKVLNMQYHLDHVMPLSLRGKHEIENAEILCSKCNQKKHAMHPDEWAVRLGRLFI